MSVVLLDRFDNPHLLFKKITDLTALSIAEFEHNAAGRLQKRSRLAGNASIEIQAIPAAIQSLAWVKVTHFRFELVDFRRWYVRRIANDQVKPDARREGSKSIAF